MEAVEVTKPAATTTYSKIKEEFLDLFPGVYSSPLSLPSDVSKYCTPHQEGTVFNGGCNRRGVGYSSPHSYG